MKWIYLLLNVLYRSMLLKLKYKQLGNIKHTSTVVNALFCLQAEVKLIRIKIKRNIIMIIKINQIKITFGVKIKEVIYCR